MGSIYLDKLSMILDNIERIQQRLLVNKKDIENIISLIKEFSSKPIDNSLDDPIVLRAKKTLDELIKDLQNEYYKLEALEPDENWEKFHKVFTKSLKAQIEGYKEIFLVFLDGNVTHINIGMMKIKEALNMLNYE